MYYSDVFLSNRTTTAEIYTLSLHDALPICGASNFVIPADGAHASELFLAEARELWEIDELPEDPRSEEHTSELQSQSNLVCRLLLEKKKKEMRQSSLITEHDKQTPLVDFAT